MKESIENKQEIENNALINNNINNNINNEKYNKYKEIFDKYKNENENEMISEEALNEILIKYNRKIPRDSKIKYINFNQFIKLMEKENIDISNNDDKKCLSISKLILFLFLLLN